MVKLEKLQFSCLLIIFLWKKYVLGLRFHSIIMNLLLKLYSHNFETLHKLLITNIPYKIIHSLLVLHVFGSVTSLWTTMFACLSVGLSVCLSKFFKCLNFRKMLSSFTSFQKLLPLIKSYSSPPPTQMRNKQIRNNFDPQLGGGLRNVF